jgi:hypothetical protein
MIKLRVDYIHVMSAAIQYSLKELERRFGCNINEGTYRGHYITKSIISS